MPGLTDPGASLSDPHFTDEEIPLIEERDQLAWRKAMDEPMTPAELERLSKLNEWLERRCVELYGESQGLPPEVLTIVNEVLGRRS